jgi:hypothetical protein
VADQHKVTAGLGEPTFKLINDLATERRTSRADIVRGVLDRYAVALQIPDKKLQVDREHIALIAKTFHGKSFLTIHHLIPTLGRGRKVVVLDQHEEYRDGYDIIPLRYTQTIPPSSNQIFQTMLLMQLISVIDKLIDDTIDRVAKSKRRLVSVAVDIVDPEADRIIISEFGKRLTARRWSPGLLLVGEEASKYDWKAVVSRGRHSGIQAVLLSQFPLDPETMSNVRIVLGPINPTLAESIDPRLGYALLELRTGEFLWEYQKGRWAKFRHRLKG